MPHRADVDRGPRNGPAVSSCTSHEMLQRLGEKWTYLVVTSLGAGEERVRSSELRSRIDGISQRMLTVTLRNLERDGMVERRIHAEVPPRVDYALTPLGRSMLPPLREMTRWIDSSWSAIEHARSKFDGLG